MGKKAKKKAASAAKGATAAAKSAEARAMPENAASATASAVPGASAFAADAALASVRASESGGIPELRAEGAAPSGMRAVAAEPGAAGDLLTDAAPAEGAASPDAAPAGSAPAPDAAAEGCPAADRAADAGSCCTCRHKSTERSQAFQADVQKRLNRAIGQLNGVKAMIDDNRYCGDVLVQLAASEAAVRRVSEIILQDHLETCVVEQIRAGNVEVVDEAMKLIRKFM